MNINEFMTKLNFRYYSSKTIVPNYIIKFPNNRPSSAEYRVNCTVEFDTKLEVVNFILFTHLEDGLNTEINAVIEISKTLIERLDQSDEKKLQTFLESMCSSNYVNLSFKLNKFLEKFLSQEEINKNIKALEEKFQELEE